MTDLLTAAAAAADGPRGKAAAAAEAEAEAARIGAAARRKAEREAGAALAADLAAEKTGRRVTWQRTVTIGGERRTISEAAEAGRYGPAYLADLTQRAAREAGAILRRGRLVRQGGKTRRVGRMILTAEEGAAMAAEAAILALDLTAAEAGRLPRIGAIAEALAPAVLAEAPGPLAADLAALRGRLLDLARDDRPQPWRDCAEALRAARSGGPADLADCEAGTDILAEADRAAWQDGMIAHGPGRHPLSAETQAAAYLAWPIRRRIRLAVLAALAEGRPGASAADLAEAEGVSRAAKFRDRTATGRRDLRAALADPDKRAAEARRLADLAEAEDGPRRDREALALTARPVSRSEAREALAEADRPRLLRTAALARLAARKGRKRAALAAPARDRLALAAADLAAARRAADRATAALAEADREAAEAATAARPLPGPEGRRMIAQADRRTWQAEAAAQAARQRVRGLARNYRAEAARIARPAPPMRVPILPPGTDLAEAREAGPRGRTGTANLAAA